MTADLEFLKDALDWYRNENSIECLYESRRRGELTASELRAEISKQKPQRAIFFDTSVVPGDRSSSAEDAGQGDECMKDTVQCIRQGSRQLDGDAKVLRS